MNPRLATWRLWALGPDGLPDAFDSLCGPLGDPFLARAVLRFGSDRACEQLLESVRGREILSPPESEGS